MSLNEPTSIRWHSIPFLEVYLLFLNPKEIKQSGGLNIHNVLDYFALSPFWDPECNNQTLKMQTQYTMELDNLDNLSQMRGLEFAVVAAQDHLFVIEKRERRGSRSDQVIPLQWYYIIKGDVFQAPDVLKIFNNRLLASLSSVTTAFDQVFNKNSSSPSSTNVPSAVGYDASGQTLQHYQFGMVKIFNEAWQMAQQTATAAEEFIPPPKLTRYTSSIKSTGSSKRKKIATAAQQKSLAVRKK